MLSLSHTIGRLPNLLVREWQAFKLAIGFLTRIPVRVDNQIFHRHQHGFVRYFALVGVLQAGILGLLFYTLMALGLSQAVSLLLIMIFSFRLTGAFHEDGLADVADGIGGAFEREKKIEIMKDSRLGTYGLIALWSALTLKFFLLVELPYGHYNYFLILMVALGVSRVTSLAVSWQIPYIGEVAKSKGTPKIHSRQRTNIIILLLSALALALFVAEPILFLLSQILIAVLAARYFSQKLGGYNGDCLGATQQVSEISCYLYFVISANLDLAVVFQQIVSQ